eukprot:scaffold10329_cov66-Cyclotella_meneghiniana.AAC.8
MLDWIAVVGSRCISSVANKLLPRVRIRKNSWRFLVTCRGSTSPGARWRRIPVSNHGRCDAGVLPTPLSIFAMTSSICFFRASISASFLFISASALALASRASFTVSRVLR